MILEILSVGLIIPFLNSLVRGGINFGIFEFLNNLDIIGIVLILVFYLLSKIYISYIFFLIYKLDI